MKRIVLCVVFLIASIVSAQPSVVDDSLATLCITTSQPGAELFLNGRFAGKAPLQEYRIPSGVHVLRLFSPSAAVWNAFTVIDTLILAAGVRFEKHYTLGSTLTLQTIPFGSTVVFEEQEIGLTPFRMRIVPEFQAPMILRKEGYRPEKIQVDGKKDLILVTLIPEEPVDGRHLPEVLTNHNNGLSRPVLTYTAAGSMVLTGVLAAALKQRANENFDIYLRTKDSAQLASTRRLDRQAGIAFAITQVSFALLTYLLLSE